MKETECFFFENSMNNEDIKGNTTVQILLTNTVFIHFSLQTYNLFSAINS